MKEDDTNKAIADEECHEILLIPQQRKGYTLNELFEKIGYTKYHFVLMSIIGLSLASDGIEIFLIYLLSPILQRIYLLSDTDISIITAALFLGIAIGALLSSITIKHFGRKYPMMLSMFLSGFFGTTCVMVDNIIWFTFCRLIIGISVGFLFNFPNALCEILPRANRDFIMGSIYIYVKCGVIYVISIFYLFSASQDPIYSYKLIVICSSIPMCLCFLIALLCYDESPRILLHSDRSEEAYEVLDKIARRSQYQITIEDRACLIEEVEKYKRDNLIEKNKFQDALKIIWSKQCKLFFLIIIIWIMNNFVIFTNYYALPKALRKMNLETTNTTISSIVDLDFNSTVLPKNSSNFNLNKHLHELKILFFANVVLIPAEFLAGLLTSFSLFGRQNAIVFGFFVQFLSGILTVVNTNHLYIYSTVIGCAIVISFNITKLYTCEAFHTNLRDTAFGFANFISRTLVVAAPFLTDITFKIGLYGPYVLISLFAGIGALSALSLPFDTYRRPLDTEEECKKVPNALNEK